MIIKNPRSFFLQFVKFGIVGLSNTIISYSTFCICIYVGLHYFIANLFGFTLGVLNAFYWSNKYVFKLSEGEKRNEWHSLIKSFLAYGFSGIIINSVLLAFFVEILGIIPYLSQLFAIVIRVPLNFVLNKFWSFKSYES